MKFLIIGSGGVGGYFGAKLSNSGQDVTFIARGNHLAKMKEKGLYVKSFQGDFTVFPINATDNLPGSDKFDVVIMAVKAWQVKEMTTKFLPCLKKETIILPLQNGIKAAGEISEIVGKEHVIGGLCRIISKIDAPGIISHFGVEPLIVIGELNNTVSERINQLKSIFIESDINCKIADDIQSELWKKFISICVSGLLAVTCSTYGQLRELPETRELMFRLLTEIYNVSQKAGISINSDYVEKSMAYIDNFPYDSTSSLTRDVWEGKPSEIFYQNGTVVELGLKYGIETPVNKFVFDCILPQEIKARKV